MKKKGFMQILMKRHIITTIFFIISILFITSIFFDSLYDDAVHQPIFDSTVHSAISFQDNWNKMMSVFQRLYQSKLTNSLNKIKESVYIHTDFSDDIYDTISSVYLMDIRSEMNEINWSIISPDGRIFKSNDKNILDFDFSESMPEYWKTISEMDHGAILTDKIMHSIESENPGLYSYYKLYDGYTLKFSINFKKELLEKYYANLEEFEHSSKYIKSITVYTVDYQPFFGLETASEQDKILFHKADEQNKIIIKDHKNGNFSVYRSNINDDDFMDTTLPILRTKIEIDFSHPYSIKNNFHMLFSLIVICLFSAELLINFGITKKLFKNLKRIINRLYEYEKNPKVGLSDLDKHNDFKETEELGNAFKIMAHKLSVMFNDQERINKTLEIANNKLEILASHDELTGVENRRTFYKRIQKLFDNNIYPWSIVFIDMDNLKMINDRFGHNIGDKALFIIGNTLEQFTRSNDYISRIGGDEFLLALVNIDEHKAEIIMNRINNALLEKGKELHPDIILSISFGVYTVNSNNVSDIEKIIQTADAKMYINKNKKKKGK